MVMTMAGAQLASAGIGAGTTLAQSGIQMQQGKKGHERNKELMDIQLANQQALNQQGHNLQYEQWLRTNYPEQVEQLKKAGLNPSLLYGKAGTQGGTTGSQGGGQASSGSYSHAPYMDMSTMMTGAQIQKILEEVEMLKAQREKLETVDTDKVKSEIDKIIAETENEKVKTLGEELKNINQEIKNIYEPGKLRSEINLATEKTAQIIQDTDITGEMKKDLLREQLGKGLMAINNSKLITTKDKLTDKQISEIDAKLYIMAEQLALNKTKQEIESGQLELNKYKVDIENMLRTRDIDVKETKVWVDGITSVLGDIMRLIGTTATSVTKVIN
jgi:hypothetical protein